MPHSREDKRHAPRIRPVADAEVAQAPPKSRALLEALRKGSTLRSITWSERLPPEFQLLQYRPRPWTLRILCCCEFVLRVPPNTWRLDVMREALAACPAKNCLRSSGDVPLDVLVMGKDRRPGGSNAVLKFKRILTSSCEVVGASEAPNPLTGSSRSPRRKHWRQQELGVSGKHTFG